MNLIKFNFVAAAAVAAISGALVAGPEGAELARRQARSVHLMYTQPQKTIYAARGTVTVTENQTNSYYMAIGWATGYCGIQDVGGRRILIFSVWEPSDSTDLTARADAVEESIRAKVLYADEGVQVSRFGGEGTGAKTITDIGWKVGEGVTAEISWAPSPADHRTECRCRLRQIDGSWRTIAVISTLYNPAGQQGLGQIYSFVEDFWRNYTSATLSRRAEFSDFAVRTSVDGEWTPLAVAKFTADETPSPAIDAGRAANGAFFLQTGGATTNAHVQLKGLIK